MRRVWNARLAIADVRVCGGGSQLTSFAGPLWLQEGKAGAKEKLFCLSSKYLVSVSLERLCESPSRVAGG
jgi:hypothetical protein